VSNDETNDCFSFMREFGATLQVVRDMPFARQYKLTAVKEPLSSSGQGKGLHTMKVAAEKLPPEEQRRYIHYPYELLSSHRRRASGRSECSVITMGAIGREPCQMT
jgi:hypothetical protein